MKLAIRASRVRPHRAFACNPSVRGHSRNLELPRPAFQTAHRIGLWRTSFLLRNQPSALHSRSMLQEPGSVFGPCRMLAVVGGMFPVIDREVDMYQLRSRGEPVVGLPSETLNERAPLISALGASRRQLGTVAIVVILAMARMAAQAAPSSSCESLAGQKLPNTTITTAQAITTGSFTPPGSTNAIDNLPPLWLQQSHRRLPRCS